MHLGLHSHLLFPLSQIWTFSVSSTSIVPMLRMVSSHNSHSEKTPEWRTEREALSTASLFLAFLHSGSRGDPLGQHQTCFLLAAQETSHHRLLRSFLESSHISLLKVQMDSVHSVLFSHVECPMSTQSHKIRDQNKGVLGWHTRDLYWGCLFYLLIFSIFSVTWCNSLMSVHLFLCT